jgi:hypothetical protein
MGRDRNRSAEITEHKIEDFAEDLGKMLGKARAKPKGGSVSVRQS